MIGGTRNDFDNIFSFFRSAGQLRCFLAFLFYFLQISTAVQMEYGADHSSVFNSHDRSGLYQLAGIFLPDPFHFLWKIIPF